MVNKDRDANFGESEKSSGETMREGMEKAKAKAAETIAEAQHRGKSHVETQKERAAEQAGKLSDALGEASARLREEGEPSLARYTEQIASSISGLAEKFRDRSVDDLLRDTRDLARREPALFLAGSVALGFAISRFFKASSSTDARQEWHSRTSAAVQEIPDDPEFGAPSEPAYGGGAVSNPGAFSQHNRSTAQEPIDKTDFDKKGA
jgi:hypothetical protein